MTAPERRRPLPALAFIGALSLLTALVWFRVLHRSDDKPQAAKHTQSVKPCPTATPTATNPPAPTVLPTSSRVTVLVLNSTDRNGIAGKATTKLKHDGFGTKKPTDDAASYGGHGLIKGVAEIRYPERQFPAATLLSYYFPQATLVPTYAKGTTVYVSLGAKYTKVARSKTVKHALKQDRVTLKKHAVLSAPQKPPAKVPARCRKTSKPSSSKSPAKGSAPATKTP